MKSYRVVLFLDMEDEDATCTDDALAEVEYMQDLYNEDGPKANVSISSVTPTESKVT
jgi:hypothetical protein